MQEFYNQFDRSKPVIIFGDQGFSQLARYVIEQDSPFTVVAHTVDSEYLTENQFDGLPVLPFEQLEDYYLPSECYLLIPLGYTQINGLRMARFKAAKERGYAFISYLSSRANYWPNLKIGENSMVYENVVLQPFVSIGDNCIIRSAAHLSHHVNVRHHSFIAAGVFTGGNTEIG